MPTMDEKYGDGSSHTVCGKCGMCITCKDCACGSTLMFVFTMMSWQNAVSTKEFTHDRNDFTRDMVAKAIEPLTLNQRNYLYLLL